MTDTKHLGKLVIPSIILSRVITQPPLLITGLLLIEIAQAFNIPVAIAGQLNTSASILVVIGSVAMSYLALRFDHKALLMTGLVLFCCSYLCCYLSPTFFLLLISFAIQGVARAMVDPMTTSFVGRLIPEEKRAGIISLFFAGLATVILVLSPLVGYLSSFWSWRLMFLLIALPFPVIAFITAWFALPKTSEKRSSKGTDQTRGFHKIWSNLSAMVCLICALFSETVWGVTIVYGFSFIRERFNMAPSQASLLMIGTSCFFLLGSLLGGRLVNRVGRRTLAVFANIALGVFTLIYFNIDVLWLSIAAMFLNSASSSLRFTASESLVLEQIPELQGSVMSLYTVALGLGAVLGSAFGGYALLSIGYGGLGFFGVLGLVAAFLFKFYTVDPVRGSTV